MPNDVDSVKKRDDGKKNKKQSGRGSGQGSNSGEGFNNRNNNNSRKPTSSRSNQNAQVEPGKVNMKKYERMISEAHTNFSDIPCGEKSADCDICCKANDVFGIGSCRHPVCAECVIRMRVLGNSKTCPVCRADIDILLFCTVDEDIVNVPLSLESTGHPDESRFGIRFNNKVSAAKYEKYLAHVCKICENDDGGRLEFPSFMSLRQHMASRHMKSYCHICTDNLNLFSRERKAYTRDQLHRHMIRGDFDDKSFKGHPQCLFCEQKFLDEENRYRHLRKEHFFCQFCESDGTMINVFFGRHDELNRHYKESHYICESDECRRMGIAFANKFELDLHRANEHAEKRNLIDLGFRPRAPEPQRSMERGRGARSNDNPPLVPRERIALVQRNIETNPQSDPSLFTTVPSAQSKGVFTTKRSAFTSGQQDFPSLFPSSQASSSNVRFSESPRPSNNSKQNAAISTVEAFPSLEETSSSTNPPLRIKVPPLVKKRLPPPPAPTSQKSNSSTSTRNRAKDQSDDYLPPRDVPQAIVKVNNSLLRFDTVNSHATTVAKSNIQMIKRDQKPTAPSSSSGPIPSVCEFPSLPTPSTPLAAPVNSTWINSKNSNIKSGIITSVTVPVNYSKAIKNQNKRKNAVPVPKTEVWSSLGPAPEGITTVPTDTWLDIPLSKEAQLEKDKKEKKEAWARKKAEIQAKIAAATEEKLVTENIDAQLDNEKARSLTTKLEDKASSVASESSDWSVAGSKHGDAIKNAEIASIQKKKKKNKSKTLETVSSMPPTAVSSSLSSDTSSSHKIASCGATRNGSTIKKTAVADEPVETSYQEKMNALWNIPNLPSVSSMFSSFSLSSMLGMGPTSIDQTTTFAPPPGLENVVLTPPPGLGFPAQKPEDVSFASAPVLSHDDIKEKREKMETEKERQQKETKKEDDGWVTTAKPKNKKNNKKK